MEESHKKHRPHVKVGKDAKEEEYKLSTEEPTTCGGAPSMHVGHIDGHVIHCDVCTLGSHQVKCIHSDI